ncbi:MAG: hypothetical protein ACREC6_05245 [Hyphomicrobiaceae bacterium]
MGIHELTLAARAAGFAMVPPEDEIPPASRIAAEPLPGGELAPGRTTAIVPVRAGAAPRWSMGFREWWLALSGRAAA